MHSGVVFAVVALAELVAGSALVEALAVLLPTASFLAVAALPGRCAFVPETHGSLDHHLVNSPCPFFCILLGVMAVFAIAVLAKGSYLEL